ncbi:MAG: response regulator transcription factor [Lachnospiraceae bacterium]|nr:response regulator transcription factor [Lachnospiraceae bacterium]
MKIAVCDNSSIYRELIADILNMYFSNNFNYRFISHEIIKFDSSAALIYDFEEGSIFDIIFIDVYMKKLSGIETARRLRQKGYKGAIILISETAKYAVEGYEVEACRYMIKPFGYEEIASVMDKLVSAIEDDTFVIHKRNEIIRLPYSDIVYVDSSNTRCFVHSMDNERYVVYKRLDEIEKELNDKRFLRSHKSYLVNMSHVCSMDKCFHLTNGDVALIRQRGLKDIRKEYIGFLDSQGKSENDFLE